MHLTKLQRAIIKLTVVVILAIVLIRVYQPELALMTHPSPAHQQELVTLVQQHGLGDTLLLIATIGSSAASPSHRTRSFASSPGSALAPSSAF